MEDRPLTAPPRARASAALDRAVSALLRYDLSRTDVLKWVAFARQTLLVMLVSVVAVAGLSAFLSTREATDLLSESLDSEARAIAGAVARAAYVPLSLEDDDSLRSLVASYGPVGKLGLLRVVDERGRARAELFRAPPGARLASARVPILPLREVQSGRPAPPRPVGWVEVGLRTDWIDAKTRVVALTNVALCGGLALAALLLGTLVVRNLVERTRELVGEARLVAEVKRVNEELEAFSYSVAHDLRAPLRAVDGFGQALFDAYADKLDEEGKDYLRRLHAASRRMGQLIDDLLNLSRVSRGTLKRARVDLGRLGLEIAARLRASEPAREVEFAIPEGLWTDADPSLARVLLENLLGNSWKYTARRARARIELGAVPAAGGRAFFVRDDGAGFDMAFSGKLFQPFSRLHSPGEFEGTGIGLATVARIAARHGGRVWGEGEVGRGATFYFTLGGRP